MKDLDLDDPSETLLLLEVIPLFPGIQLLRYSKGLPKLAEGRPEAG